MSFELRKLEIGKKAILGKYISTVVATVIVAALLLGFVLLKTIFVVVPGARSSEEVKDKYDESGIKEYWDSYTELIKAKTRLVKGIDFGGEDA